MKNNNDLVLTTTTGVGAAIGFHYIITRGIEAGVVEPNNSWVAFSIVVGLVVFAGVAYLQNPKKFTRGFKL